MNLVKKNNRGSRLLIYGLIALAIFAIWKMIPDDYANAFKTKSLLLCGIYVLYIAVWIKFTKTVKSLFFFFFCYTALTNAGQLFLIAFDLEIMGTFDVREWANVLQIKKAMDYQMLCTVCMCTCALFAHELYAVSVRQKQSVLSHDSLDFADKGLTGPDILYIASGLIFVVFNILRLGTRVDSTYMNSFNSGETLATPLPITMLFYISMYYACYAHRAKGDRFKKTIIIVNVIVGITNVLYGSRNVLIPLIFGMVFMWRFDLKKMSFMKKAGVVFGAVALMYLLGAFLNIRRTAISDLSFEFVMDGLFGTGLTEQLSMIIAEMGGSLRVLTTTMTAVDRGVVKSEPTFLYTFLKGVVPKVEIFGFSEPIRWRLSAWITDTYGDVAGWGYSMYAEAYYNFKELGFLFMAFFGYLYVWLECKIEKWYLKGYTVMASAWLFVAVYVIFLARADSILITTRLRYAVYVTIVCVLCRGKVKFPSIRLYRNRATRLQ